MDAVDRLTAISEIQQLISRRARLIDGKHWGQLVDIYVDDIRADHVGTSTSHDLVEHNRKALEGVTTIHRLFLPEIEVLNASLAKALVPMEDLLLWEVDGLKHWVHGFGHYHQEFVRTELGWLISKHNLTRQYLQEGQGDFGASVTRRP